MVDFNLETSEVLKLQDTNIDTWIYLNCKFKTVMITENTFVVIYNEQSLEEHKERLTLSHLGFDTDNEKGDEWVPEEEEFNDGVIVEKLNTDYEYYSNPYESVYSKG